MDWHATTIFSWHVLVSHLLPILFLLLLTSGRYVAMHAMQEDSGAHEHSSSNGYGDGNGSQKKQPKASMRDTLAAVGGMLIPLLTQLGHQR